MAGVGDHDDAIVATRELRADAPELATATRHEAVVVAEQHERRLRDAPEP